VAGVRRVVMTGPVRRSPPLWVDPVAHGGEIARFERFVVPGPSPADCAVFCGAIGDDAYGRFWLNRDGVGRVVRAHRYALAVALGGRELPAAELALHECDNPLCVRVVDPAQAVAGAAVHVVTGTQAQNMQRMGRRGRGGGRAAIPVRGEQLAARVRRSRALRAAVRGGWDGEAVAAAFLDVQGRLTLW
jgi:hypothetical protein